MLLASELMLSTAVLICWLVCWSICWNCEDRERNVETSVLALPISAWRLAVSTGALATSFTDPKKPSSAVCRLAEPLTVLLTEAVSAAYCDARLWPELADHRDCVRNWLYERWILIASAPWPT